MPWELLKTLEALPGNPLHYYAPLSRKRGGGYLKSDGTVWMGRRDGLNTEVVDTQVMSGGVQAVAVSRQGYYSILKSDGTLWGKGGTWAPGPYQQSTFTQVMSGVQTIADGDYHMAVVKNDGTVWTVGYNAHAQLGDGSFANGDSFVQVFDDASGAAPSGQQATPAPRRRRRSRLAGIVFGLRVCPQARGEGGRRRGEEGHRRGRRLLDFLRPL